MSDCCHRPNDSQNKTIPACHAEKHTPDWLFWCTFIPILLLAAYAYWLTALGTDGQQTILWLNTLSHHVLDLLNTIWWGIVLGIVMIAVLANIPREFVMCAMGTGQGLRGIVRATAAGVLLDLCSHGILMVGSRLYERGASIGQIMAFLIASPWNSFSLTLILLALIGLPLTLLFIALSMLIAIVTGYCFDDCVRRKILPDNPHRHDLPEHFLFWPEAKIQWQSADKSFSAVCKALWQGVRDSRMVIRWIFVGVLLASVIQTFVSTEHLAHYFGASMMGLLLTMIAATVIEVCSEGSTPIAADLVTRAQAPGNGFAFLMAGVSTDYTEIMVLRDTTQSWKIALFMPLITLPQIFVIAWLLN